MKRWTIVPSLLCAGLLLFGCERKDASETSPEKYDPDLDPPVSILEVTVNPDLIADQAAISRRMASQGRTAAPPPTTPEATGRVEREGGDAIERVRGKLTEVLAAVTAGDKQRIIELFAEEDAESLQFLLELGERILTKGKIFEDLLRTRLGMKIPGDIKSYITGKSKITAPGVEEGVSIDDLKFEQVGQDVVVTDPKGQKMTFSRVGNEYRASLPQGAKELLGAMTELAMAQEQFIDRLTGEINRGRITEENFEAAAKRAADEILMPPMGKFMKMMFSTGGKGAEGEDEETGKPEEALDPNQPEKTERPATGGGLLRNITKPLERMRPRK